MVREFDSVLALFLLLWASIASAQSKQLEGNRTLTVGDATIDVNPRLAFRCVPGKAEITARIDWQRFISSFNTEVGFKVDGGKFVWVKWGVDQSNKITMSKTASDSQALIDHLASGSELLVEISPYSESPVTVQYDLGGLSEGLDALRAECQKTSD
jgi:hypothetical protein